MKNEQFPVYKKNTDPCADNPLVSIIITTYNRSEWLSKAIKSIRSQSYTNWELIIWNDGSTDDTESIVNSFDDHRIIYYFDTNHGMSYALNKAISLTKGEYIAFLDDDDSWEKEKLSKQMDILQRFPIIDILFSNFINFDSVSGKSNYYIEDYKKDLNNLVVNEIDKDVFIIEKGIPENLLINDFIGNSTVIMKKEIFNNIGYFNEKLKTTMDLEFWWRAGLAGYIFCYQNEILAHRNWLMNCLSRSSPELYINKINCLNLCRESAKAYHRDDLVKILGKHYDYSINRLIRQYALESKKREAAHIFFKFINKGLSFRRLYLFLGAMAGPQMIKIFKRNIIFFS